VGVEGRGQRVGLSRGNPGCIRKKTSALRRAQTAGGRGRQLTLGKGGNEKGRSGEVGGEMGIEIRRGL